jgi:hypothetical protein
VKTHAALAWSVLLGALVAACTSEPVVTEEPSAASRRDAVPSSSSAAAEPSSVAASAGAAIPDALRREGPINGRYVTWEPQWGKHNVYLRRLIHLVQIQWERNLASATVTPPPGAEVAVRFVLNSEGRITRILDVEANAPDEAIDACVRGIVSRAPYLAWTPAMKIDLGDEQEIAFTFHYQ